MPRASLLSASFVELFYLVATALFVLSLHWMGDPKTARRGVFAGATAMGLAENMLPPTANFTEADPECDLDFVPNEARPAEMNAALSNSLASS